MFGLVLLLYLFAALPLCIVQLVWNAVAAKHKAILDLNGAKLLKNVQQSIYCFHGAAPGENKNLFKITISNTKVTIPHLSFIVFYQHPLAYSSSGTDKVFGFWF